MRILLIEDDELLGEGTKIGLGQHDLSVDWVTTHAAADAALSTHDFDVVLLDIGLPDGSGLDLLKSLRSQGKMVPILLLTARDTKNDKVVGLDSGADDYVVKPFDLDELSARIRALQRRSAGRTTAHIHYGALRLDPGAHTVELDGDQIHLPMKEFELLQILLENAGKTVPRQRLLSRLYGWGDDTESNPLDVYVHNLRKKLGKSLIKTIRGVGYKVE